MSQVGVGSGQAGNAVPLQGESEIRMQKSGIDGLTITQSSNSNANFLVLRDNVPKGTTSHAADQFVVSSGGILSKFGMYNVTASSGGNTIGSSQSGSLWVLAGTTAAAVITLPTPAAGSIYTFYIETAPTTGAYSFTCGTSGAFIVNSDSGADGFALSSVAGGPGDEGGFIQVIGLSATKYAVLAGWPGSSAVGSTASLATAWVAKAS
jgi:hypothetical protein